MDIVAKKFKYLNKNFYIKVAKKICFNDLFFENTSFYEKQKSAIMANFKIQILVIIAMLFIEHHESRKINHNKPSCYLPGTKQSDGIKCICWVND